MCLCLFKECSKKTKTDDQENASVDVPSPAQENGEASSISVLVSTWSKQLLLFFSSLGAHVTRYIIASKKKNNQKKKEGAKKPMPEAKHAGQLEAHDLQGKNVSSQDTPSQSIPS